MLDVFDSRAVLDRKAHQAHQVTLPERDELACLAVESAALISELIRRRLDGLVNVAVWIRDELDRLVDVLLDFQATVEQLVFEEVAVNVRRPVLMLRPRGTRMGRRVALHCHPSVRTLADL